MKSQLRCTFDLPLLGEYYSYENGLEAHTSLKDNGDIDRLFYRRQSGLGATANIITILDNYALGECFNLIWRENPLDHMSKNHYQLIYRDKFVFIYKRKFVFVLTNENIVLEKNLVFNVIKFIIEHEIFFKFVKVNVMK